MPSEETRNCAPYAQTAVLILTIIALCVSLFDPGEGEMNVSDVGLGREAGECLVVLLIHSHDF